MKKFYKIILLLTALIFLSTFNPKEFNLAKKKSDPVPEILSLSLGMGPSARCGARVDPNGPAKRLALAPLCFSVHFVQNTSIIARFSSKISDPKPDIPIYGSLVAIQVRSRFTQAPHAPQEKERPEEVHCTPPRRPIAAQTVLDDHQKKVIHLFIRNA